MNNLERFVAEYTKTLEAAIRANPADYCNQDPLKAGTVARKISLGLAAGTANLGDAGKRAAKNLGIKPTYKAIREFFEQDDKPITAAFR